MEIQKSWEQTDWQRQSYAVWLNKMFAQQTRLQTQLGKEPCIEIWTGETLGGFVI